MPSTALSASKVAVASNVLFGVAKPRWSNSVATVLFQSTVTNAGVGRSAALQMVPLRTSVAALTATSARTTPAPRVVSSATSSSSTSTTMLGRDRPSINSSALDTKRIERTPSSSWRAAMIRSATACSSGASVVVTTSTELTSRRPPFGPLTNFCMFAVVLALRSTTLNETDTGGCSIGSSGQDPSVSRSTSNAFTGARSSTGTAGPLQTHANTATKTPTAAASAIRTLRNSDLGAASGMARQESEQRTAAGYVRRRRYLGRWLAAVTAQRRFGTRR